MWFWLALIVVLLAVIRWCASRRVPSLAEICVRIGGSSTEAESTSTTVGPEGGSGSRGEGRTP
jgi:hypothetical protein